MILIKEGGEKLFLSPQKILSGAMLKGWGMVLA
jgi:hypothetical protein